MSEIFDMTPWGLLNDLLNVSADRFDRVWKNLQNRASGRFPPVNVFTDDDAVMLEVLLPGKTAKDVDVTMEEGAVVVADHPAEPAEGKGERPAPAWARKVELPFRVDETRASASFQNGILRVQLPRKVEPQARRIQIQCG